MENDDDTMEKGLGTPKTSDLKEVLTDHYRKSVYCNDMEQTLGQIMDNYRDEEELVVNQSTYATSAFWQVSWVKGHVQIVHSITK